MLTLYPFDIYGWLQSKRPPFGGPFLYRLHILNLADSVIQTLLCGLRWLAVSAITQTSYVLTEKLISKT